MCVFGFLLTRQVLIKRKTPHKICFFLFCILIENFHVKIVFALQIFRFTIKSCYTHTHQALHTHTHTHTYRINGGRVVAVELPDIQYSQGKLGDKEGFSILFDRLKFVFGRRRLVTQI